jgi:hypothetical protein
MNTYARPAEGAKDQKQIKIKSQSQSQSKLIPVGASLLAKAMDQAPPC